MANGCRNDGPRPKGYLARSKRRPPSMGRPVICFEHLVTGYFSGRSQHVSPNLYVACRNTEACSVLYSDWNGPKLPIGGLTKVTESCPEGVPIAQKPAPAPRLKLALKRKRNEGSQ